MTDCEQCGDAAIPRMGGSRFSPPEIPQSTSTESVQVNNTAPISRSHSTNRLSVAYTISAGAQSFSIASVGKLNYVVNGQTVPGDLIYQGFPLSDNDTYPVINCTPAVGDELIVTETR